ncbi:MAG: type II secretion system F family protein [Phycisphaerae bacterium]|nr:type II secretion system F family protein [Phycisphaerae bacterium]
MTEFAYKAVDRHGASVSGSIEAVDRKSALTVLAEKGRFVTEIGQKGEHVRDAGPVRAEPKARTDRASAAASKPVPSFLGFRSGRMSSKDVVAMTTQLSTALRAGLPLMACLQLLRDQQKKKPAARELMDDLVQSVSSGMSLSEAMAKHPRLFSPLYLSMIRVGETGGLLEQTSTQLAQILSRDEKVKTSVKNAAAYPILLLCLGLVSVVIIVTWILPTVMSTMDVDKAAMPLPTRILLGAGDFVKGSITRPQTWVVLAAVVAGIVYGLRWLHTEGRVRWDSFKLHIPILGSVLRTIAVGRFSRTLGALTKGGVPILEALGVVRDTLGNEFLARQIDDVADQVRRGASLAEPLDAHGYFPPLLIQIVAVGEQTGKLDELLLHAAETFDTESDAAITRFMSVFPAILILLLAVVIGFIIVATLLPMVVTQLKAVG